MRRKEIMLTYEWFIFIKHLSCCIYHLTSTTASGFLLWPRSPVLFLSRLSAHIKVLCGQITLAGDMTPVSLKKAMCPLTLTVSLYICVMMSYLVCPEYKRWVQVIFALFECNFSQINTLPVCVTNCTQCTQWTALNTQVTSCWGVTTHIQTHQYKILMSRVRIKGTHV